LKINSEIMKIFNDYSLLEHNTFGMDVKTRYYVMYDSEAELSEWIKNGNLSNPWLNIGGGSNLLFTKDYEGTVLHSVIMGMHVVNETPDYVELRVGSGEVWDELVEKVVDMGWYGMENLSLIPGEVGASAVQNIGAYGVEAKDLIVNVEAVDLTNGSRRSFRNEECKYAYRQSIFKNELKGRYAITYVTFRLKKQCDLHLDYGNIKSKLPDCTMQVTAKDVRNAIIDIRNEKLPDPKVLGNAGSFFMNPIVSTDKFEELLKEYPAMPHYDAKGGVKIPAGWMIEQCGLKGVRMGRVGVHDKQALVLVNYGGARPEEIVALSELIINSVKIKFGVDIKAEVNFI